MLSHDRKSASQTYAVGRSKVHVGCEKLGRTTSLKVTVAVGKTAPTISDEMIRGKLVLCKITMRLVDMSSAILARACPAPELRADPSGVNPSLHSA
jgi:hypothetical protein